MTLFIFLTVLAYLMGSICSAVIVCKMFSLPDPRLEGSKNPGATNVLRIAGKHFAALVMVADMLKGLIPVLIAQYLTNSEIIIGFTALAAVLGHMYPVFFGFRGGKGVATTIGAIFGVQIIAGTLVAATWLLVAKFSRYSSLASIISIILAPFFCIMVTGSINIFPPIGIITMLVLFKHRENITRIFDGVEPKINLTKSGVLDEVMAVPPTNPHEVEIVKVTPVSTEKVESVVIAEPAVKAAKPRAKTAKTAKPAKTSDAGKKTPRKAPAKPKKPDQEK